MKKITKYQANDGSEWHSGAEAMERDKLIARVLVAMAPLGDTPQCVMEQKGYIQHDVAVVNNAKEAILQICRDQGMAENFEVFNHHGSEVHPRSIVGRILNDLGGPLDEAWSRFARIDAQGREHDQPYFAYGAGKDEKRWNYPCVLDRREAR